MAANTPSFSFDVMTVKLSLGGMTLVPVGSGKTLHMVIAETCKELGISEDGEMCSVTITKVPQPVAPKPAQKEKR